MPREDGTGLSGLGPMAGRGAGFCNGLAVPGYASPVGFAGEFGRGRGFRRVFYATGMPGWARCGCPAYAGANTAAFDEKMVLSNQAEFLEAQLQQIKKRLSSLDEENSSMGKAQ